MGWKQFTLLKVLIPLVVFIGISLLYFKPVLKDKHIFQSDISQYRGMVKELIDYRKTEKKETYWINSAFGGMPTYQLGAKYPHMYAKKLDNLIRFLPRPADYLFLYCVSFYILLLVLKVDYRLAIVGAIGFGLSTYLIIILGVGHNSKAHAIGYMPLVLSGVIVLFRNRYLTGFFLTLIALCLEIYTNHYQMTYYLFFLLLVFVLVKFVESIFKKKKKSFLKACGVFSGALFLALMVNATSLLATYEYAKFSTRGKNDITENKDGAIIKHKGLDYEHITEYSYGFFETLNLFIPRIIGGSNSEDLGEMSNTYEFLKLGGISKKQIENFTSALPTYWGSQPIVVAPAYVGMVIVFLMLFALLIAKNKNITWLLLGVFISLIIAWGKNVNSVTVFLVEYFPFYNKFRAVSSAQVILEICIPVIAMLGLNKLIKQDKEIYRYYFKRLKIVFYVFGVTFVALFAIQFNLNFSGQSDELYRQYFGEELMELIVSDRQYVYNMDLLRSLTFSILTGLLLYFFLKGKVTKRGLIAGLCILIFIDLNGVDKRYVNDKSFTSKFKIEKPFDITSQDLEILNDKSHYRVFEPSLGTSNSRTSFFHKSLGGYHAAKPKRIQNIYDFYLNENNFNVLDMFNVKYIIQNNSVLENPNAIGNAWFINKLHVVPDANAELRILDTLPTKTEAVIQYKDRKYLKLRYDLDENAKIELKKYRSDKLVYYSENSNEGLVVFSEIYYPKGWQAFVNNKPVHIYRVNYTLRAVKLPAGNHKIVFKFEPAVVKRGTIVSLFGYSIIVLIVLGCIFEYMFKNRFIKSES